MSTYRQRLERVPSVLGKLDDEKRCDILRRELNRLIQSLYDPDAEVGWRAARVPSPDFGNEAINWGDLSVLDVELHGSRFIAYVEELAPDSYTFGQWLVSWANRWGWSDVQVVMEW